jgi:hypothetical protein
MAEMKTANVTAVVGSLMPIKVLQHLNKIEPINKIVVSDQFLVNGYKKLIEKYISNCKINCISKNKYKNILDYLILVLSCKIFKKKIIIFHECGMPWLDIFILLIKPNGLLIRQVTNNQRIKINADEYPNNKIKKIIKILNLQKRFQFYKERLVSNDKVMQNPRYLCAVLQYPIEIKIMDTTLISGKRESSQVKSKNILILLDKYLLPDEILKKIYRMLVEKITTQGFICYVKEHPAEIARVNFNHDSAIKLDPLIPIELMDEYNFICAIGIASAGLFHYINYAISIIYMLQEYMDNDHPLLLENEQVTKLLEFLNEGAVSGEIKYAKNVEDLIGIIKKYEI